MGLELGQAGLSTLSLVEVIVHSVSDNKRDIVRRLLESCWSGVAGCFDWRGVSVSTSVLGVCVPGC